MTKSILFFVLAGLLEIGGGWLVWKWWRDGRDLWWGLVGGVLLATYGVVATYQPAEFGRVYAAYGGVFIAMSLVWAWLVAGEMPDGPAVVGALMAVAGVGVMMYWPRG